MAYQGTGREGPWRARNWRDAAYDADAWQEGGIPLGAWRPAAKGGSARKAGSSLALKLLLGIVVLAIACELLYIFALNPMMKVSRFELSGALPLPEEEIIRLSGVREGDAFASIETERAERAIAAHPAVLSCTVEKRFPDVVAIRVVPRLPVAFALGSFEGSPRALLIDAEGCFMGAAAPSRARGLPLVSGLGPEDSGLPEARSLFKAIAALKDSAPALVARISEIAVARAPSGGFDLVIYPVDARARCLAPRELNEERLKVMMLVVDALGANGMLDSIKELDFRSEAIRYSLKGGGSLAAGEVGSGR
jgi:hypothetical protein